MQLAQYLFWLKLTMSKNPSVAFLTHDWAWGTKPLEPNGCSWYRCKLPSDELKKHGWTSTVGFPGFGEDHGMGLMLSDGSAIHGWDIIVLKLIMHQEILDALPRARSLGQKIIVDIDDAHDELHESNSAYHMTSKAHSPEFNREIYAEIIMSVDAVITSTPYLFDYYSRKRNNVYMVRNGIDAPRWKQNKFKKNKYINIGWVGATNYRSFDLQQLDGFIGDYIKKNQFGFIHSGVQEDAPKAHMQLGIPDECLVGTNPVKPISIYPSNFKNIDIGICPLNDIPFNYAKSFIKGLEYAAAGVPFVATDMAEYTLLASQGVGRVAKTEDEWLYHFDELRDVNKRKDDIEINYENLKNFTMEKRGADWDATFRHILENI